MPFGCPFLLKNPCQIPLECRCMIKKCAWQKAPTFLIDWFLQGRFTWGPKFQHGGQVPIFEPQDTVKIWLVIIKVGLYFMQKYAQDLLGELGLAFCSTQASTQAPSLKPHLQKVLSCKHPCHTWDLRLGTPCEVISPNFHAIKGGDCTDRPQVTWELGPVWTGPYLVRSKSGRTYPTSQIISTWAILDTIRICKMP
jgi:hypothetical protein